MLGFSTEDVREMFTYYKNVGRIPADSDVEAIIQEMKPWYDNYCFSKKALETQSKVFNCDMVIYYLRNYMDYGQAPDLMIDPNTKTDYNKMKKLLQLDKLDGDRKGVIRTIAETGQIVTSLENTFPASRLTNPQTFTSLLFYYGMLTIKDTFGDMLILGIPNNNVRKQYYGYLLEQYQEEKFVDLTQMKILFTYMALEGKWRDALEAMAKAYENVSSVRDGIESERNLQGFFMAYLNLCNYYITAPELELNHGFCDFFLLPNLAHYAVKHSYIIELKVLPKKDFSALCEDRKTTKAELMERIRMLRERIPDITLRTTLICGFPGETQDNHEELMQFVNDMEFDRLGAFTYSPEEGTKAAAMPDQIDEDIKAEWQADVMELEEEVIFDKNETLKGKELYVFIEGKVADENAYIGRTYRDAPNVDGYIFINTDETLMTGNICKVMVTGAYEYDLIGELVK